MYVATVADKGQSQPDLADAPYLVKPPVDAEMKQNHKLKHKSVQNTVQETIVDHMKKYTAGLALWQLAAVV